MALRVEPDHKRQMRETALDYRRQYATHDQLGLLEGIGARVRFVEMDHDGAFDPENNIVLINAQIHPRRQKFTLAHEISHALLLRNEDLLSDLHDAYADEELEEAIEVLCNVGAAALLIPPEWVERTLDRGLTATGILNLIHRGGVSASAALIALAEATPEPALLVLCSPQKVSGTTRLAVHMSSASSTMRYTLSAGTPIPTDHPIQWALDTAIPIDEISYIPFRSGKKMNARVSACADKGRVLAVFFSGGERA
ncbi:MAG: ImmA/IrrE family metallo-endopeptidase [Deinococcaceae bacterium]